MQNSSGRMTFYKKGVRMEQIKKRAAALLSVKSIVTIILTVVFAFLAVMNRVTAEQFLTVFTVVIAFYFGTQSTKKETGEL